MNTKKDILQYYPFAKRCKLCRLWYGLDKPIEKNFYSKGKCPACAHIQNKVAVNIQQSLLSRKKGKVGLNTTTTTK